MKIKLLLLTLAFGLMSGTCSNDDDTAPVAEDCNCGVITEKFLIVIPNNTSTKLTIKNNCTDAITTKIVTGNQGSVGQQWCND